MIGDEKYECMRLNVITKWRKSGVGSVYWISLRGLVFGI